MKFHGQEVVWTWVHMEHPELKRHWFVQTIPGPWVAGSYETEEEARDKAREMAKKHKTRLSKERFVQKLYIPLNETVKP